MADKRKPGKARAWSAGRARASWEREFPFAHMCDMRTCEMHLTRAYLAGIKAASARCFFDTERSALTTFAFIEQSRLGLAPTGTSTSKGGKRKSGEGRK